MSILSISKSQYLVLGIQFRQCHGHIADRKHFFQIYIFAWKDPETQGLLELIINVFKECQIWMIHTYLHKNAEGVMFKIRL